MSNAAPATVPPEGEPTYVVTGITAGASGLYTLSVVAPDGVTLAIIVPGSQLSLRNVRLSAAVVGFLWETMHGATPLAIQSTYP